MEIKIVNIFRNDLLGYKNQIRPTRGLAGKHGIITLNSPGTIYAD